jgi:hypothetical protein
VVTTVKILSFSFSFLCVQYSLSLHVRHSSENRSEIRETLHFFDFLRVVGICAVVYEDMPRERERDQNSNDNNKDTYFFLSFGDMKERELGD